MSTERDFEDTGNKRQEQWQTQKNDANGWNICIK